MSSKVFFDPTKIDILRGGDALDPELEEEVDDVPLGLRTRDQMENDEVFAPRLGVNLYQ